MAKAIPAIETWTKFQVRIVIWGENEVPRPQRPCGMGKTTTHPRRVERGCSGSRHTPEISGTARAFNIRKSQ
jgi:hypothetical protein